MNKREFLDFMEELAPAALAQPWDNCGLLVDAGAEEYTRVLLALDLTSEVVREAAELGAELILTHHPIMLGGLSRIDGTTHDGIVVRLLLTRGISHFAAHTNLDASAEGVNRELCARLGMQNIASLGLMDNGLGDGETGLGFAGDIEPCTLFELAERVKLALGTPAVRVAGAVDREVRRVAVAGGSGFSLFRAALAHRIDAFISGDVKHHNLLEAIEMGAAVIDAGHHETEHIVLERLIGCLQQRFDRVKYNVAFTVSGAKPPARVI